LFGLLDVLLLLFFLFLNGYLINIKVLNRKAYLFIFLFILLRLLRNSAFFFSLCGLLEELVQQLVNLAVEDLASNEGESMSKFAG